MVNFNSVGYTTVVISPYYVPNYSKKEIEKATMICYNGSGRKCIHVHLNGKCPRVPEHVSQYLRNAASSNPNR